MQIGPDWYTPHTWTYDPGGNGCGLSTNCSLSRSSCTPTSPYFCFGTFKVEGTLPHSGNVSFYTEWTVTLTDSAVLSFQRPLTLSCDGGGEYVVQPQASKGTGTSPTTRQTRVIRDGTSGAS